MLRGFTRTYVMQYRDKQTVRHRREPWRLQTSWMNEEAEEDTWTNSDAYAADPLGDVEISVAISTALRRSRDILVERGTEKRDYERFINLAVQHGYMDGKLDYLALQDVLGVSRSTVTVMLNELRDFMRPLLTEIGLVREPEPVTRRSVSKAS